MAAGGEPPEAAAPHDGTPPGAPWRRDLRILFWLSLPFLLAAAALLVLAETWDSNYWQAMEFAILAIGAAALWGSIVAAYLLWTLIRDGITRAGIPAIAILVAIACAGAVRDTRIYEENARCHAGTIFFDRLAALPPADRAAAIAGAGALLHEPSPCTRDALLTRFGRDPIPPAGAAVPAEAERHDVLAKLLAAGLPPDERTLYAYAADEGDPAAVGLLLERRQQLNAAGGDWDLFPDRIVRQLLRQSAPCGQARGPDAARWRTTLRALVAAARPLPSRLDGEVRRQLACLEAAPPPGSR